MNVLSAEELIITIPDSLLVFVIGMMVIFFALVVLIGVVYLYCALLKERNASAQIPAVAPLPSAEADEELVAVITAAVTASMAAETEDNVVAPFKIRSIRLK